MKTSKTLRIGSIKIGDRLADIFCKVELEDGKLSITGVEGPKSNGDCVGSCGQIDMSLRNQIGDIIPASGWDSEKLTRFFQVWHDWHLNDMRAACQHQKGPEWTPKDVTLYHFRLRPEIAKEKREVRKRMDACATLGQSFIPTAHESETLRLKDDITLHQADIGEHGKRYEPNAPCYTGDNYNRPTTTKSTGWLTQSEHPEGYLSKPCPVCGYKYGSQWLREELPADVIAFLESLPETDKTPAWV